MRNSVFLRLKAVRYYFWLWIWATLYLPALLVALFIPGRFNCITWSIEEIIKGKAYYLVIRSSRGGKIRFPHFLVLKQRDHIYLHQFNSRPPEVYPKIWFDGKELEGDWPFPRGNYRPFDLAAARQGAPIRTREGTPVRLLDVDRSNLLSGRILVALTVDGEERTRTYFEDGSYYRGEKDVLDLVMED